MPLAESGHKVLFLSAEIPRGHRAASFVAIAKKTPKKKAEDMVCISRESRGSVEGRSSAVKTKPGTPDYGLYTSNSLHIFSSPILGARRFSASGTAEAARLASRNDTHNTPPETFSSFLFVLFAFVSPRKRGSALPVLWALGGVELLKCMEAGNGSDMTLAAFEGWGGENVGKVPPLFLDNMTG